MRFSHDFLFEDHISILMNTCISEAKQKENSCLEVSSLLQFHWSVILTHCDSVFMELGKDSCPWPPEAQNLVGEIT